MMIRDSGLLFWATLYMSLIGQEKKHYVQQAIDFLLTMTT